MILEETARAQPQASTCEWRQQDEEHFDYDPNGNRTLGYNRTAGTTYTGTYDDQDRLLSYGPFDYTYTANGELETKTNRETGEAWLFQYDALGNLLTVGLPNGDLVDYLVDGMGRRVGKKKNGVVVKQWLYRDALKPVAELDGSGNLVSEFVYGSKSNVPDYVVRGGATYRVISDQLGSPRYVVNVNDASDVPFTATYTSFGVVTGTGLDWMPFGFAGGIYDSDSECVRFGMRDLESRTGRWLSKEPQRFGAGSNFYGYSHSDPVNFQDPDGRGPWSAFVVAAGCETKALADAMINWYVAEGLMDQINALRRLRDMADKEIAERQSCGDDVSELMQIRDQEDREITGLAKEYSDLVSGAGSDFGLEELACLAAGAGAALVGP